MTHPAARILVVDDNEALRENLAEALEAEGYDAVAASDGAGALARLGDDSSVRGVLLDLSLPGMDGREILTRIRADPRLDGLRVVITTGHAEPRVRAGLIADAFLLKPFGIRELLAALHKVGL